MVLTLPSIQGYEGAFFMRFGQPDGVVSSLSTRTLTAADAEADADLRPRDTSLGLPDIVDTIMQQLTLCQKIGL